MLTAAAFQHTNRHVRHHLHRLGTRRPASTVPGARRPPVTTARASSSALVAKIVTGLAGIAERFATALNGVDTGLLADGVLNQSPTRVPARCHPGRRRRPAQTADARRTLGRARPRPAPHGFTVGNFAAKVPTITGTSDTNTPSAKRAYDLRKLRGNQLVDKPARTRRHRVPAPAARTIAALLTVRDQVIAPILAGIRSPRMGRKPKAGTRSTATTNSSAAYRQTPLDDLVLTTPAPLAG